MASHAPSSVRPCQQQRKSALSRLCSHRGAGGVSSRSRSPLQTLSANLPCPVLYMREREEDACVCVCVCVCVSSSSNSLLQTLSANVPCPALCVCERKRKSVCAHKGGRACVCVGVCCVWGCVLYGDKIPR